MGETTAIEWTHHSWSPWFGCTKVHVGCTNCYSEADNARYKRNGSGRFGPGQPRVVRKNWDDPLRWARAAAKAGERRRVFISLCDPLDEEAPKEAPERLWDLIRETAAVNSRGEPPILRRPRHPAELRSPGLDWLLLTKRPERWRIIPEDVRPLVWLGTSISDQATADEWVPRLLAAEGFRLRFLSVEPLVGPVDLALGRSRPALDPSGYVMSPGGPRGIDWIICGGESGPGARPCDVAWIRSVVEQCRAAGTACFVKQLGSAPHCDTARISHRGDPLPRADGYWRFLNDKKGGDPSEWPADLRVREFPEARP